PAHCNDGSAVRGRQLAPGSVSWSRLQPAPRDGTGPKTRAPRRRAGPGDARGPETRAARRRARPEDARGPTVGLEADRSGLVAEVGREPALGLLDGPALALGVVGDLVPIHPTDREV